VTPEENQYHDIILYNECSNIWRIASKSISTNFDRHKNPDIMKHLLVKDKFKCDPRQPIMDNLMYPPGDDNSTETRYAKAILKELEEEYRNQ
jgi:hypothetical protein